jgi:hypothetical protein
MEATERDIENLQLAHDVLCLAVEALSKFPADYQPPELERPSSDTEWKISQSVQSILADPLAQSWLREVIGGWPAEFFSSFIQAGSIVAQTIAMFESGPQLFASGLFEPSYLELLSALAQLRQENSKAKTGDSADSLGLESAFVDELLRRQVRDRVPFARTLTTMLGPDALMWLTAQSQDGVGKLQPHELARSNWHDLWSVECQLRIEQELLGVPSEGAQAAKIVVSMAWALVALASFMPPAIFLGESTPHLSSRRGTQFTVSKGAGTHAIVVFDPQAVMPLLRILADGLQDPLLSASDLMWIAAALLRIREIREGLGTPSARFDHNFDVFLSHRGPDAKAELAAAVLRMPRRHGVFLDCLTSPRGELNRSFLYGSMVRSKTIVIVETANYRQSPWCKKEEWLSERLTAHGVANTVVRLPLHATIAYLASERSVSSLEHARAALPYPIAHRVLRDIDYWARAPNLHSLREKAPDAVELLTPLQAALQEFEDRRDAERFRWLCELTLAALERVVTASPSAEPFDLWAAALQFSLAAFGASSSARAKMAVRRGVDQLIAAAQSFVLADLHEHPVFRADAGRHLALIAGAVAIDLASFDLDPEMRPALQSCVEGVAIQRDGLLFLDVRPRGHLREFRLRLLSILVEANVGGVGLIQDSRDQIHQSRIGNFPLEVLPCVTIYPGLSELTGAPPSL